MKIRLGFGALPADLAAGPQQGALPLDPTRGRDPFDPRIFVMESKSKLLEAAKLHAHIGLNTYLGKINTCAPISNYELSTLNSASNVVLQGKWVSHSHFASLPSAANATNSDSIVESVMHGCFLEAYEMEPPPSGNTHPLVEDESSI
ncbi:hypothetical protein Tco_0736121 [Tanacetum coccineum]